MFGFYRIKDRLRRYFLVELWGNGQTFFQIRELLQKSSIFSDNLWVYFGQTQVRFRCTKRPLRIELQQKRLDNKDHGLPQFYKLCRKMDIERKNNGTNKE